MSAGKKFRTALENNKPLQIVGTINAYTAMMAKAIGHQAIYLSGGGVANASYGLPDLGMTSLNDVIADVQRITSACDLPLMVDIDTGWGGAFNIAKTIRDMEKAGAAAVHMEDQVAQKRCGHRPNKEIVSTEEMVDRIKAAVDARTDPDFFIMARTDAFAQEGLDKAIERAKAYVAAGADGIFAEAVQTEEHYRAFAEALDVPILANITEFDDVDTVTKTPEKRVTFNGVEYVLPHAINKVEIGKAAKIGKLARSRLMLNEGEIHTNLLHIAPGGGVPEHTHKGFELTVLLDGTFHDEKGEYVLGTTMDKNENTFL